MLVACMLWLCAGVVYVTGGRTQVNVVVSAVEVSIAAVRYVETLSKCPSTLAYHSQLWLCKSGDTATRPWLDFHTFGPLLQRSGSLFPNSTSQSTATACVCPQAYDHASSTWQSLPDMLQPRYAHAVVAQGGCLYSLGGQASKAIHRWEDLPACCVVFVGWCWRVGYETDISEGSHVQSVRPPR